MAAAHYDITIDQGALYTLPLTFFAPSSSVNPTLVPVDLTGYTAAAQIRDDYNNANILAQFSVTFSGSTPLTGSVSSNGSLVLSLLGSQSAVLPSGLRGVWDLFLYPNGDTDQAQRMLEGTAWIRPRVTR